MKGNREKILQKSLELFNLKGSGEVTTNRICQELSISPGNLYYHFRSKDEIILSLFERMIEEWDKSFVVLKPSLESLELTLEKIFESIWEYRFLHREMPLFIKTILGFEKVFQEIQKRRLAEIQDFIFLYSKSGVFRKMNIHQAGELSQTIWFFLLYWVSFLEVRGVSLSKKNINKSIGSLNLILAPYINHQL